MTTLLTPLAFQMPAALFSRGFTLRSEREDDVPFLQRLYASTRTEELAQAPWSEEQKQTFLAHQFAAQRQHYRTQINDCLFQVIEKDGAPTGRLYLQWRETQLHVVDIALLPDARGQGVGTLLLEALIAAAADAGRALGIFVEKFNPALHLYRRLGFVEIGDTGVYLEMERPLVS
jgi:ribosomal protein S18 acetylase RimI-like enzyme